MKTSTAAARTCLVLAGILITSITASAQVLSVTPTSVTATGTAGAAVASKSVTIKNSGKGALKWTVSQPTASWVGVSPTSGTQSGTLTVSFPTTFSAGTFSASFVVNANNGQSQVVTVNLTIDAAGASPTLTGLSVLGPTSVTVGQTAQYTARATYSDGSTVDRTTGPTWSTSNSLASITQAGVLSALAGGTVTVTAVSGGLTAMLGVSLGSTSASLLGVSISGPASVTVGQTAQYVLQATYTDGSSKTVNATSWWILDATATITQAGVVTGVSAGTATIHAYYTEAGVTRTAENVSISVVATTKTLTSLSIAGSTSVTVGQTAQYTATASYSDGSSQNMTSGPAWSTSSTSLATITQSAVASALAAGTVNVQATYNGMNATPLAVTLTASSSPSGYVIYVSPSGSDSNAGTQSSPVRTIQRGVDLANLQNVTSDVTVLIGAGTYREAVQIFSLNTTKALTLQGAGPSTILTGADDWSTGWTLQGDGSYAHAWPYKWGTKPIPNGWGDYWNWDGNGYKRNRLLRWEMVFVNGLPLTGVLSRAEMSAAGAFYVDESGSTLYMRLPTGVGLAGSLIEVGIRKNPLSINGRNNVTLRSLAIMRNIGAIQESMIQIGNLQNLTVDKLEVRWGAYAGFSTAYVNGLQIYNSIFSDNGVNGIDGYRDTTALMQDSEVARNNWRGWAAEHKGFDTVHKWSEGRDITIRRGQYIDNFGHGLWFDGDNQRILIDQAFSARNKMRGAYFELNAGPLTLQNSKLCENGFEGVANARSNYLTVNNNQIFNNKYWQITATGSPTPVTIVNWQTGQSYLVTGANWTLTNNIVKGQLLAGGDPPTNECYPGPCGWAFWAPGDDSFSYIRNSMTSDYNRYYHSGTTRTFNVPTAYGGALDFTAFRSVMQSVKPTNESHSVWGDPGALSCTAP